MPAGCAALAPGADTSNAKPVSRTSSAKPATRSRRATLSSFPVLRLFPSIGTASLPPICRYGGYHGEQRGHREQDAPVAAATFRVGPGTRNGYASVAEHAERWSGGWPHAATVNVPRCSRLTRERPRVEGQRWHETGKAH
ncbi:hypothetical protein GCM10022222_65570 [Amycolatopsis ultiminotia]|uniref:Uncharacterized protein n=1 Tax=Amycolatopsis ultiminotia TaxID=543629 RepID=A0ABP6XXU6_9PSEU